MRHGSVALLVAFSCLGAILACESTGDDGAEPGGTGGTPATGGVVVAAGSPATSATGGVGGEAGQGDSGGTPASAGTFGAAGAADTPRPVAGAAGALLGTAGAAVAAGGVGGEPSAAGTAGVPASAGAAGAPAAGSDSGECIPIVPGSTPESDPCFAIPDATCDGVTGPSTARSFCFNYVYELVPEVQGRMAPCMAAISDPCADGVEDQVRACIREARSGLCPTAMAIAVCMEGGVDFFDDPYAAILDSCDDGTLTAEACLARMSSFQTPDSYYPGCMDPSSPSYDPNLDVTCAERLAICDEYD